MDSKREEAEKNEHMGFCVLCPGGANERVWCNMVWAYNAKFSVCLECFAKRDGGDLMSALHANAGGLMDDKFKGHPGYHGNIPGMPEPVDWFDPRVG